MCTLCQALFVTDEYEFHDDLANSQALVETTDAAGNTSTSYSMTASDTFSGSISSTTDTDWIEISIPAGEQWEIGLTGTSGTTDPIVSLYDSGGNFLLSEQGYDGFTSSLTYTNTSGTAQTFYIQSTDFGSDGTGGYTISINASTPPPLTVWTDQEIAEQLKNGYWSSVSNGGLQNVAWDVSPGDTLVVDITRLTADGQFLATKSLEAWTFMTGINFSIITDPNQALTEDGNGYDANGSPSNPGGIIFDDDEDGAFANFQFSGSHTTGEGGTADTIYNAKVNISTGWLSTYGTELDTYSFQTYIHEIGHALGLGHGGDYNGSASYPADAKYLNDNWQKTVMSYFSQTENTDPSTPGSLAYIVTPMVADIIAVQELYGVAGNLRSGDTTYGYNSNAGGYYDDLVNLTGSTGISFTILDDGGIDTLDLSGMTVALRVDLNDGAYSDVGGETENLFIYDGTMIENFIGGSAADSITGNEGDNTLDGGAGNDSIDGGAGNDTINGEGGNDTITGGTGNDVIDGGIGNDSIDGGDGNDVIDGGTGNDTLVGGGGDNIFIVADDGSTNTIDGNFTNDTIDVSGFNSGIVLNQDSALNPTGSYDLVSDNGTVIQNANLEADALIATDYDDVIHEFNVDLIYAGAGNDEVIVFGSGAADEAYYGGDGIDTLNLADASGNSSYSEINLGTGALTGTGGAFEFENVTVGSGDNTITGTTGANSIVAGDGNDVIYGNGFGALEYSDQIYGGDGNDQIFANGGYVEAGIGNDFVKADNTIDETYYGGDGTDTLDLSSYNGIYQVDLAAGTTGYGETFAEFENVIMGSGDNTITGTTGGNSIVAGDGNDVIYGNDLGTLEDSDQIYGGDGNDQIFANGGYVEAGIGNDFVKAANVGFETYYGGDGIDTLDLSSFNGTYEVDLAAGTTGYGETFAEFENVIMGNGANTVAGTSGANSIQGGSGSDEINGRGGSDSLLGGAGDDTLVGDAGADDLFGGSDTDHLYGGGGGDSLDGGIGNDSIFGGASSDILDGGDGDDYLNGEGGSDVIDGGDGNDSIIGEIGFNTITGGLGDDIIDSGVQDDSVDGGSGNDTIMGNSGNDILRGGADADSISGGAGTDTIHGDAGVDILLGSYGDDFVYGGTEDDTLGGNGGEDTLYGGSGADSLDGGANDDSLSGGDGADSLFGAGGNDILDGDAQADTIDGGAGADTIRGGDGDDLLIGNGRSDLIFGDDGNDFIQADGAIDTAYGGIGDDEIYGGAQRDTLFGGADDDTITGEFGNDSLFGGAGADILVGDGGDDDLDGGAGNDTLTGGSGGDDFIFLDTGSGTGVDLITDFQNAVDTLQFDDALWAGTLTAQQIVADFATGTGTAVVFDFGNGNVVTVDGITDSDTLTDNILII